MNRHKFLTFLVNGDGLSYYYNNGVLAKSSTPVPLEHTFDGWKDMMVQYIRNPFYWAVFRSLTIPLRFVKHGAQILRELLYKKGYEENVYLIILRLNPSTGRMDGFYKGEIDFSKFQDDPYFFQVNVSEGGLMKFLKAYESTNFEIPLTGDGVVNVEMNGLELKKKFGFALVDAHHVLTGTIGLAYAYEEGTSFGLLSGTSPTDASDVDLVNDDNRWFLKNIGTDIISATITGKFPFNNTLTSQLGSLFLTKSSGTQIELHPLTTFNVGSYTLDINATFTINPGERVYFQGFSPFEVDILASTLEVTFNSKYKTTYIKAINAAELGDRLIKQIAGPEYSLDSTLLKNCGIYITCGNALRGFSDAKIKTTFKDLFTNFNRNLNIGMSVSEKVATIKSKKDYYTSTLITHLGEIKNFNLSLSDDIFNDIKVGYPDETFDDVNGRDAFNQTQQYKAPVTRVSKTLDLTGNYKADPYAVEFARINLEGKTTTDASSDNDVFMLDVELQKVNVNVTATFYGSPVIGIRITSNDNDAQFVVGKSFTVIGSASNNTTYTILNVQTDSGGIFIIPREQTTAEDFTGVIVFSNAVLRRKTYDSITGVINPSAQFNIELSDKRIVYIHGDYIRSAMWGLDNKKLTFQTTNKNAELKTVLAGVTIEEKSDVDISKLNTPYFYPLLAKFETIVPEALNTIMEANSTGVFSFEYRGDIYKGYCMEAKQKPSDDEAQEWTLLLSIDNDLNKLIHG